VDEIRSPARKETPRDLSVAISAALEPVGWEIVEGRRRTVMVMGWTWDGASKVRCFSTGMPSSPAPRTRMERVGGEVVEDIVSGGFVIVRYFANGILVLRQRA
jgi:hypothetical protein